VFICVCNGVTEKQIRDAVSSGTSDLAQLQARLGVGAGCGTCAGFAQQVIAETIERNGLLENRVAA
jgi:bacterioferritin-associated ferredoxin